MRLNKYPLFENERGSALVEFIGAFMMIVALMLMVLQVSIFLYVRTVAVDALTQGAQLAARYDANLVDGVSEAQRILENNFGNTYIRQIDGAVVHESDGPTVILSAKIPIPFLGFVGIPEVIEVSGNAPLEVLE